MTAQIYFRTQLKYLKHHARFSNSITRSKIIHLIPIVIEVVVASEPFEPV